MLFASPARTRRIVVAAMLAAAAAPLAACTESAPTASAKQAAPPPEVGFVTLRPEEVAIRSDMAGRVVSFRSADVRPQVGGIVEERVFEPGSRVKAGDVLFRIDPRPYQAALASSEASLAKYRAALPSVQAKAERYANLSSSAIVSQQDREDAQSLFLQTKADIAAAEAAVETARINLGYTEIKAPIDGVTGTTNVNAGTLLTAGQSEVVATIRQLDPIYVDLTESSGNLIRHRAQLQAGSFRSAFGDEASPPEISLSFADGTPYARKGAIEARERFVSETTSSFTIRSRFDNPDAVLLPGMYVRAALKVGINDNGFLVPQRAVSRNNRGEPTAMFVKDDDTVESRVLTISTDIGSDWVVTSGVKDGDRIVVDGFQKLQVGKPVSPVEVILDENGVAKPVSAQPVADAATTTAKPQVTAEAKD